MVAMGPTILFKEPVHLPSPSISYCDPIISFRRNAETFLSGVGPLVRDLSPSSKGCEALKYGHTMEVALKSDGTA